MEGRDIRFVPTSPDLDFPKATPEMVKGARTDPYVVNSICAQCHSSSASTYPDGSGT